MTANSTPESFDAVVAEMRRDLGAAWIVPGKVCGEWAGRLQSAHARELAEQQATIEALRGEVALLRSDAERIASCPWRVQKGATALCQPPRNRQDAFARADAAMGLLREVTEWIDGWSPNFADDSEWQPVADRIDAFLAQQALAGGERKDVL